MFEKEFKFSKLVKSIVFRCLQANEMDQQITEHSSATWDLLNSDPNEQANDVYFSNKHSPDGTCTLIVILLSYVNLRIISMSHLISNLTSVNFYSEVHY